MPVAYHYDLISIVRGVVPLRPGAPEVFEICFVYDFNNRKFKNEKFSQCYFVFILTASLYYTTNFIFCLLIFASINRFDLGVMLVS